MLDATRRELAADPFIQSDGITVHGVRLDGGYRNTKVIVGYPKMVLLDERHDVHGPERTARAFGRDGMTQVAVASGMSRKTTVQCRSPRSTRVRGVREQDVSGLIDFRPRPVVGLTGSVPGRPA